MQSEALWIRSQQKLKTSLSFEGTLPQSSLTITSDMSEVLFVIFVFYLLECYGLLMLLCDKLNFNINLDWILKKWKQVDFTFWQTGRSWRPQAVLCPPWVMPCWTSFLFGITSCDVYKDLNRYYKHSQFVILIEKCTICLFLKKLKSIWWIL